MRPPTLERCAPGSAATALLAASLLFRPSEAAFELGRGSDHDLSHFVTRPDIKAPILESQQYLNDSVSAWYIFSAPYASLFQSKMPTGYYQPCQTGPHIYHSSGELVWSGACHVRNQNIADFRPVTTDSLPYALSAIEVCISDDNMGSYGNGQRKGRGLILDDTYRLQSLVQASKEVEGVNMHEFRVVQGSTAIHIQWKPEYTDVSMLGLGRDSGWVGNMGFREVDIATNQTVFEWWALGRVPLSESTWPVDSSIEGPAPFAWDAFHLDSVDKNDDGDYLVSARHTDSVYKVSHSDHSIIWRLGGSNSSFSSGSGLFLRRQHSASFVRPIDLVDEGRQEVEYISLFNNLADENEAFGTATSALVLRLDALSREVIILRQITQPEGSLVPFGGNTHTLPDGKLFVNWGRCGHSMTYTSDGAAIFEVRFTSDRFANYRSYLADWRARPPLDELVLACSAFGASLDRVTTACWVSWNGATEVRSWRFDLGDKGRRTIVKDGFETMAQFSGHHPLVAVEALDIDGNVLGRSGEEGVAHNNQYPT